MSAGPLSYGEAKDGGLVPAPDPRLLAAAIAACVELDRQAERLFARAPRRATRKVLRVLDTPRVGRTPAVAVDRSLPALLAETAEHLDRLALLAQALTGLLLLAPPPPRHRRTPAGPAPPAVATLAADIARHGPPAWSVAPPSLGAGPARAA